MKKYEAMLIWSDLPLDRIAKKCNVTRQKVRKAAENLGIVPKARYDRIRKDRWRVDNRRIKKALQKGRSR